MPIWIWKKVLQISGQAFTPHRPPMRLLKKTIRSLLRSNVLLVLHTGLYLSGVEWYITLFPLLQMMLILIIRNEHKMAFSPLKIIPLPAQNCLFTVQNWLTNFHVSQLKNWSHRLVQLEKCLMKDIIFWWAWYVCSWRPNVIYWRQKMYWNPFSIFPFRPNYVILEMYLPLPHTKIFVELLKEMWFVILKNIQNWTFISLHWLLETLQSKLQLKSPENKIK